MIIKFVQSKLRNVIPFPPFDLYSTFITFGGTGANLSVTPFEITACFLVVFLNCQNPALMVLMRGLMFPYQRTFQVVLVYSFAKAKLSYLKKSASVDVESGNGKDF